MIKKQFLGDEADLGADKNISIISAPMARSLSWGPGSEYGPEAIIEASPALEVFDDELLFETVRMGIDTLPTLDFTGKSCDDICQGIDQAVTAELDRKRFPVLLGGEHTVTVPAVAACLRKYPDLHVLQVDAHLDLRDEYEGDPMSHACVMRRIHEMGVPFSQVGIRSFSGPEWQLVQENGWQPFLMSRIYRNGDWLEQLSSEINGPVYITFDVDGLDPSVVPSTGTPEPGGLFWHEAAGLFKKIAAEHQIVAMDFVEFSPRPGAEHAAFSVAKLIYRALGYIFEQKLKNQ
ncbi:MAG: agmatinase [Desulfobulbaceae bacterium]|nr:agmatinase [Desulfobulbaceae bacterium]HIJ77839.1 agmatinase [Deltaproteobacteria bacterium]